MPGSKWFTFRQGNRSEYLAQYILSALGVAVKVPIEEDVGADFHCSLAKFNGNLMTFFAPFLVQIKSISEKNIIYGGVGSNGIWKKEEIEWLFSQELPLLIGLVDKKDLTLRLYTTSNMWAAWYFSGKIAQAILCPDDPNQTTDQILSPTKENNAEEVNEWISNNVGDGLKWKIPLGPALVSISYDDLENQERMNEFRRILSFALQLEQDNITYRRLFVHISKWPVVIDTNKNIMAQGIFVAANPVPGANTDDQLKSLYPILVTLAYNFKMQNKKAELAKIRKVLEMFPNKCSPEIDAITRQVMESA
jgi:hypothetical protein